MALGETPYEMMTRMLGESSWDDERFNRSMVDVFGNKKEEPLEKNEQNADDTKLVLSSEIKSSSSPKKVVHFKVNGKKTTHKPLRKLKRHDSPFLPWTETWMKDNERQE